MTEKALRSKGPLPSFPQNTSPAREEDPSTPPSGLTTSNETQTWSKATGSATNNATRTDSSDRPEDRDEAPFADALVDNRSASGTIVGAPRSVRDESDLNVLLAELDLRKAELELAQRAAAEATSRLEIARYEAVRSSNAEAQLDYVEETRVSNWVAQSRPALKTAQSNNPGSSKPHPPCDNSKARAHSNEIASKQVFAPIMQRSIPELPTYDGNISEWIAFKSEFEDSAPLFSSVQNVSRIRRALKGEARTAVKAIMYTVQNPFEIMEALEKNFGDPEEIVLTEIHNVKRMPRLAEDNNNIVSFASHVANVVATIKSLRQEKYLYAPELVNKINDKLNLLVRFEWSKYKSANYNTPDLVAMAEFLSEISTAARKSRNIKTSRANVHASTVNCRNNKDRRRDASYSSDEELAPPVKRLVALNSEKPFKKPAPKNNKPNFKTPPAQSSNDNRTKCSICNGEHKIETCADFLKISVNKRWETIKNAKLCFKCLEPNHRRPYKCKYTPCGVGNCEAGHHKLLHGRLTVERSNVTSTSICHHINKGNTYLKIIPVELIGSLGSISTLALCDEGSSMTLIERELADQIAPRENCQSLAIVGIGGNVMHESESCKIKVSIKGHCSRKINTMTACTISRLDISPQEVSRKTVEECSHLKDLVDELCYDPGKIQLVIGQDNWALIVSRQIISGKRSLPVASLTDLGWVMHGPHYSHNVNHAFINHAKSPTEIEMQKMLKQHFSIESLGVENKTQKSDPNKRALDILDSTCKKLSNEKRYEVGLLWKTDDQQLPVNKTMALNRLYNLERKLDKNSTLKVQYTSHINNLLEEGYAELVTSSPIKDSTRLWYLPHFATVHPQKQKMRLVFDAAAKTCGKSLNDALLVGPDLLESLFGVLLRFREGRIAFIADIKQMFLQVSVNEQDRDSLRFLWRGEDRENPPQEYRMKRLIFGAASSPACALYVKNKNATANAAQYPLAAEKTIKNSYMDDMLISTDKSENAARQLVNDLYALNLEASFELRGFASNNKNIIQDVTATKSESLTLTNNDTERTLGLIWNHNRDTLGFQVNFRKTPAEILEQKLQPTKRVVTSCAMSIFDPLGYISPISVLGKVLIQEIWRTGIGWDDVIPINCQPAWKSFIENLEQLKNLELPRYVPACDRKGDLFIFSDSSEKIYASSVYFVSKNCQGKRTSILVAAKARSAPIKVISIPRLELQACVLATRLANTVIKESSYDIQNKYYWSDSKTALAWIRASPRSFKSFVAHRLAEIEESTTPADWHWVPSHLNVADDATRGIPAQFDANHRWFCGPEFIRLDKEFWPVEPTSILTPTGEERANENKPIMCLISKYKDKFSYLPPVERFSKFNRLIRASGCVLVAAEVFKAKLLKIKNTDIEMNTGHIKLAELLHIKQSQYKHFKEEINDLAAGRRPKKKSPLRQIAVKIDKNDIIVLDSRVQRDDPLPILHAKDDFTQLLIYHFHEMFNHGNHTTVMNELRQRYHIIGLRNTMRYIGNKCQWCRTFKGATLKVPEGDLPLERLKSYQPPFTATGVDLFGPMNITIGRRREKRWGVLFTCLTSRAVHLELAASLSSASMILALRRMSARRGTPTIIYSDNGTNFVGAERELKEALIALPESIKQYIDSKGIKWKKIPAGNPAAGGAWERLVGSVKAALKITLREKAPHEEVLHTLLLEAEHIINSRPLTPLSTDLNEEALTPNHILLGRSHALTPYGSFTDKHLPLSSWKMTQHLADMFWKRWVSEYRPQLLARRASSDTQTLKIGDVVLIADSSMPRGTWPRGIVSAVHPGPDGRVRVAEVRTKAGPIRRPSSRLIILCSQT